MEKATKGQPTDVEILFVVLSTTNSTEAGRIAFILAMTHYVVLINGNVNQYVEEDNTLVLT